MLAERIFALLAIACGFGLVLVLAWPRKRTPTPRPTVPASRWPPYPDT
jgi:hypothetical protein